MLENTAGQGASVGSRFEELKGIIDLCAELQLGVCIDTAHMFAAGWDLRTPEGLESVLQAIEKTVGIERVAVVLFEPQDPINIAATARASGRKPPWVRRKLCIIAGPCGVSTLPTDGFSVWPE